MGALLSRENWDADTKNLCVIQPSRSPACVMLYSPAQQWPPCLQAARYSWGCPISFDDIRVAADRLGILEKTQFIYEGRRHCFYPDGWHGPGWYWCGYNLRRGLGWGGPEGWRGWRGGGERREERRERRFERRFERY